MHVNGHFSRVACFTIRAVRTAELKSDVCLRITFELAYPRGVQIARKGLKPYNNLLDLRNCLPGGLSLRFS